MPETNSQDTQTLTYYKSNTSAFVEATQSVMMSEAWDRFTARLKEGAGILDFGCGSGRDSKYFLEKGFRVEATDGCAELCREAESFTGIKVRNELFTQLCDENKYDGVWACSSILHLSRGELESVILKIHRALKVNGIFYASFKYGDFEGLRNGRYFIDFTESSFESLIKKTGAFKILESWVTSDVRPGREEEKWLNVILQKI